MSEFDMDGLSSMLGGFQDQLEQMKADAANIEVEGIAGGGAVRVKATGAQEITAVTITDAALEDRELLEDLVRAAANEALRKAQAAQAEKLSALAGTILPPGLRPGK